MNKQPIKSSTTTCVGDDWGPDVDTKAYVEKFKATAANGGVKPAALPGDFYSHQQAWRSALVIALANAAPSSEDQDDAGYWRHEIAAFDRAYAELTAQPVPLPPQLRGNQPAIAECSY